MVLCGPYLSAKEKETHSDNFLSHLSAKILTMSIFLISLFFAIGVVKSPKFPGNYPPNLQKTDIIKVEEGMIVLLQFHVFNIELSSNCEEDSLKIVDGDGTALLPKSCGSFLPKAITSTSNIIELHFSTNLWNARSGWNISWVEVIPGKS